MGREVVGLVGDDDPGDEVGEERCAAAEEDEHDEEHADQSDVPAEVLGEAGADSADHAAVERAHDARWRGVRLRGRDRRSGDGLAAVTAES